MPGERGLNGNLRRLNVPYRNTYDINLVGQTVAYSNDSDGDGLNDASEFLMAALGFNWQISQPSLVNTYYANAAGAGLYNQAQYDANRIAGQNDVLNSPNSFGLYTLAQIQALNIGVPLLTRDVNGFFTLTMRVEKSPSPSQPFTLFPLNTPGTSAVINGSGELEFQFTVPDNAAFFRLEAH